MAGPFFTCRLCVLCLLCTLLQTPPCLSNHAAAPTSATVNLVHTCGKCGQQGPDVHRQFGTGIHYCHKQTCQLWAAQQRHELRVAAATAAGQSLPPTRSCGCCGAVGPRIVICERRAGSGIFYCSYKTSCVHWAAQQLYEQQAAAAAAAGQAAPELRTCSCCGAVGPARVICHQAEANVYYCHGKPACTAWAAERRLEQQEAAAAAAGQAPQLELRTCGCCSAVGPPIVINERAGTNIYYCQRKSDCAAWAAQQLYEQQAAAAAASGQAAPELRTCGRCFATGPRGVISRRKSNGRYYCTRNRTCFKWAKA